MPGRPIAASGVAKALTDTATSHSTHQLLPFLCPRLFPNEAASTHGPPRRRIQRLSSSSASPAALALQADAAQVKASMLPRQFTPPRTPAATPEVDIRISVMKDLQDILDSASRDPKGKATTPSPVVLRLKNVEDRIQTSILRNNSAVIGELVKTFAALDHAVDALDCIKRTVRLGLVLDIDVFRTVARNLESNHLYHHIPLLFELSKRALGRISFRMLEENTRALVKLRNYTALKPILDTYDAAGLKPRTGTYNRLLQAHLQNCDVISAHNVLIHMRQSGVAMNSRTYTAALAGARRMGMTMAMRRILSITRTAATASTGTLNAALRYQVQEKNLAATIQALEQFGMENDPRTTHLVPPDGHTYAVIINRLAQLGDLPKAVQAFAHATEHGIKPTYSMTAALIKAHVENRDLTGAYQLLSEMCRGQSRRDTTVLDPLLERVEKSVAQAAVAGRRKTIEGVTRNQPETQSLKLCDWQTMELRSLHFADLLEVVVRRIGVRGAVPILLLMRALNQPITVRLFRILTARIPPHHMARLATVLEPMIKETRDPAVMQAAANFLLEKRQLKDVRRKRFARFSSKSPLLSTIRQAKAAPIASRAATTVSTKHNHVTAVVNRLGAVSDQLQSLGVRPDRNTYAIQIRQAAIIEGNTPKARKLLQAMIDAGLKPDVRHYSALIEGYILRGNMPAAKYMMREYERFLVPAKAVGSRYDGRYKSNSSSSSSVINLGLGNVVLWTLLIVGYGRINRPDQARLAMEEMVREGVAPDAHSVHALAKVHLIHNEPAKARAALLDFWPSEAGPLTEELKKLRVRKLLRAMWKQADKQEPRRTGGPPEWNGLTKKELMEVRSGLDKIAAVWRGEPVSNGPSARLLEELERLPKASRGPSEERLTPGTLPGRSNLVSKYPAKPWSERS
ncbi:hypothetical protein FRC04_007780 [Tulasnella sp. 424]|nr:hypothetical protein FRC04_007780 [Tulasnella sp. 424]KAG8975256.1 hypothetical protein FRC05_006199 [Tulasnella sp. 425]